MQIGDNPDSATREWEGHIDDVAVWDRALSNDEIASIYNGGDGNSIAFLLNPGLIGDFNGDEVVDMADFNILVENFNGPEETFRGTQISTEELTSKTSWHSALCSMTVRQVLPPYPNLSASRCSGRYSSDGTRCVVVVVVVVANQKHDERRCAMGRPVVGPFFLGMLKLGGVGRSRGTGSKRNQRGFRHVTFP